MKRNMKEWLAGLCDAPEKKALPILSFPAVQLMQVSVRELISDAETQARGMELVAQRVDSAAAVSLMDLSVEAEAFGAPIRVSDDEVPTVTGAVAEDEDGARDLAVPAVGAGRTGVFLDAMEIALTRITDRPVFAGVIGPFSLAARLAGVSEIMVDCYDEPDMVHILMEKAVQFLTEYCLAYKARGANGVILAEPVTGLLSPALAEEFSSPYVKQLIDAVQDETFLVVYHNCGNAVLKMMDSILSTGAGAYHFGNAVDMADVLRAVPEDTVVMGNIDPAGEFRGGTVESIRSATLDLLSRCGSHRNFVISSGCDIPPLAKWENIDAFFDAVAAYSAGKGETE